MKQLNKHLMLLACVLFSVFAYAQPKYSSNSQKAIKFLEKAQKEYNNREDTDAIESLQKAVNADPGFVEAHLMLSELYAENNRIDDAILECKRVIELNPTFFPTVFYNLGSLQLMKELYNEAAENFETYLKTPRISPEKKKMAQNALASARFAIYSIQHPVPFEPKNLGPEVNGPDDDFSPSLTIDERILVFTVKEPMPHRNNILGEDFYITSSTGNGTWQKRNNMGKPVNTDGNEGAQSLSADGQFVFFTACEEAYGYPGNRKGEGSCDIFFTQHVGSRWTEPMGVGAPINSRYWDAQPSISPDGRTLYFVSNRPGGKGSSDIWKSVLNEQGYWGTAINLGDSINTEYSENSPFIHPDNSTFYFASTGRPGMGLHDLFVATINDKGEFGNIRNLGYPINTSGDEISLIVNARGDKAYYSSEMKGGFGKLDIYSFDLPAEIRPTPVTYVKGVVKDANTKKPLEARFELVDLATGALVMEAYSDPATGEFIVPLPINKEYALSGSKKGYLFYSDHFSLKGIDPNSKFYERSVELKPVKAGESIVLRNIFFETASFELKKESQVELDKLVALLNANPAMKIEISGHTDDVGDKRSNITLSENRAKAVYDYLGNKAVEKGRLSFKGYGDSKPIVSNDSDQNRAQNRRTEFTVISN